MLLIRTDANADASIGVGHVMRCAAVAEQAINAGERVLFLVSTEESAVIVESFGFPCEMVGGDPHLFMRVDAINLARVARDEDASAILIDSYAVTNGFFDELANLLATRDTKVAYIDDAFTFKEGFTSHPAPIQADVVINYGFAFTEAQYRNAYEGLSTMLCIGPEYAPVRASFGQVSSGDHVRDDVETILVTCGYANPDGILEKLATCCLQAHETARVQVVLGGDAPFSLGSFGAQVAGRVHLLRNAQNMPELMRSADIALSASGLTLYELACMGVPTVALPTAENQAGHALGFQDLGLGPHVPLDRPFDFDGITASLRELASSASLRTRFSRAEQRAVDGWGGKRIFQCITGGIN